MLIPFLQPQASLDLDREMFILMLMGLGLEEDSAQAELQRIKLLATETGASEAVLRENAVAKFCREDLEDDAMEAESLSKLGSMKREPFGTRRGRLAVTVVGIIVGFIYAGWILTHSMALLGY